eukprot:695655-Amphidinium_carterae.2
MIERAADLFLAWLADLAKGAIDSGKGKRSLFPPVFEICLPYSVVCGSMWAARLRQDGLEELGGLAFLFRVAGAARALPGPVMGGWVAP